MKLLKALCIIFAVLLLFGQIVSWSETEVPEQSGTSQEPENIQFCIENGDYPYSCTAVKESTWEAFVQQEKQYEDFYWLPEAMIWLQDGHVMFTVDEVDYYVVDSDGEKMTSDMKTVSHLGAADRADEHQSRTTIRHRCEACGGRGGGYHGLLA